MKISAIVPLQCLGCVLLAATLLYGANSQANTPTYSLFTSRIVEINHPLVKALLKQPQGLHQAAEQVARLTIRLDTTVASSMTLPMLVAASQGIFLVRMTNHRTIVDDSINSVITSYSAEIEDIMKGPHLRNLTLVIPGGSVIYPKGFVAEVRTLEADHMGDGRYWLLFCLQNGSSWSLVNGSESIMSLNLKDGSLVPMSSYDRKSHSINGPELGSFRILHATIQALISTENAHK